MEIFSKNDIFFLMHMCWINVYKNLTEPSLLNDSVFYSVYCIAYSVHDEIHMTIMS